MQVWADKLNQHGLLYPQHLIVAAVHLAAAQLVSRSEPFCNPYAVHYCCNVIARRPLRLRASKRLDGSKNISTNIFCLLSEACRINVKHIKYRDSATVFDSVGVSLTHTKSETGRCDNKKIGRRLRGKIQ